MNEHPPAAEIVLCVPGPWRDRGQFLEQLIHGTQGQYLYAGLHMMRVGSDDIFEVQFEPRDERMASSFASWGRHWGDTPEMARIDAHQGVVYLIAQGCPDLDVAALMLAAQALLDAGGFGVKVESTGLAHAPDTWRRMCEEVALFSAYNAFVVVVTDQAEAYSCGMHTFGMRDVRVVDGDRENALRATRVFTHYLYTERPDVQERHTFSCDAEAPKYRMFLDEGVDYGPDSLFANPFGTWRLERV